MKKRFIPTIFALTVFVILILYANKYEVEDIPEPGNDKITTLAQIPLRDVKAVTWKSPNQPEIRVESKSGVGDDKYKIVKPAEFRAETGEIEGVLRNFEELKSERTPSANASNTAPFGITKESPVITLETATTTLTFTLGDPSNIGNLVNLQKEGDPAVYMVQSYISSSFKKSVNDLRSRSIFHEDFNEVSSVTLQTASGIIKLEKLKDQLWKITSPLEADADQGEVAAAINGIHGLRATKFVKDNAASEALTMGFDKPEFKAVLFAGNGDKFELTTGRDEGADTYVMRSGEATIYALSKSSITLLNKDVNKLRSKVLKPLASSDVKKIFLKTASDKLALDYASATWTCEGRKIDAGKVSAFLNAYADNRIAAFVPWSECKNEGLEKMDDCESFELSAATETRHLIFGKGDGSNIAAALEGQKEVLKVPLKLFEEFKALVDAAKAPPPPSPVIMSPASLTVH